jgi:hypothetical protein
MRKLTDREFHFEIRAALMQLDHATIRDLGGAEVTRKQALDVAADMIWARFANYAVYGPEPTAPKR